MKNEGKCLKGQRDLMQLLDSDLDFDHFHRTQTQVDQSNGPS